MSVVCEGGLHRETLSHFRHGFGWALSAGRRLDGDAYGGDRESGWDAEAGVKREAGGADLDVDREKPEHEGSFNPWYPLRTANLLPLGQRLGSRTS